MYYNCNEQEEEDAVAVDACLRRPPLVLPLGNVARIETSPWPAGAQRE